VEYATKAVENGGTAIGIRCRDGVVLAVEKLIGSKLLVPGSNKRISSVDTHVGIVVAPSHLFFPSPFTVSVRCLKLTRGPLQACSGLIPDARHFTSRARSEAANWRKIYRSPIPISSLADEMGGYAQAYTLYSSVRPFGVTAIIGGMDEAGGPGLWMVEPSGVGWV
jgi:20S proteasome subunit alpha 7